MKKTLPVLLAGMALLAAAAIVRARHHAEAQPGKATAAMQPREAPAPTLPRATTQVRPGPEKDLGRAARNAVVDDLVANLKLAIAKGDANTERALREGLARYGDDARSAMEREGVR